MTIDDRLTRLTERHEALTGHVEILTAGVSKLTANVTRMRGVMDDLLAGFAGVVDLVRSHELRIEKLEGR